MTTLARNDHIAFVATTDAPRARQFYGSVLGLPFVAEEPFALVFRLHGASLRIAKVPQFAPAPFTVLGWRVRDISAAVRGLRRRGVTFERYQGLTQDDLGICAFPEGAKVAWFQDPDGNTLSLTEFVGGARTQRHEDPTVHDRRRAKTPARRRSHRSDR